MNTELSKLPNYVSVLGDPHLGRKFVTGVPPHRKGERENLVAQEFVASLEPEGAKLHVCMGDLFDKFRVPEETILFAARVYKEAAKQYPGTQFVVLRGNHDAARDVTLSSSFDVFMELVEGIDNLHVVAESPLLLTIEKEPHVFYPWHPFKTSQDMAKEIKPPVGFWAYGHWDILSFDPDGAAQDNLIPFEEFQTCAGVVTGHYHIPKHYTEGTIPVWVTGSMQPYSHAEDPLGDYYVTKTLAEVEQALAENPEAFEFKNLRIKLGPTEAPIADVNCLSLTFKRVTTSDDEDLEVNIDSFDLEAIFKTSMKEHEVSEETTVKLWDRFTDLSTETE